METQLIAFLTSPTAAAFGVMTAAIAAMGYALWTMVKRERERISIDRDAEALKSAVRSAHQAAENLKQRIAGEGQVERLVQVVTNQRISLAEQNSIVQMLNDAKESLEASLASIKEAYDDVNAISGNGASFVTLTLNTAVSGTAVSSLASYRDKLSDEARGKILAYLKQMRKDGDLTTAKDNRVLLPICFQTAIDLGIKDGDFKNRLQGVSKARLIEKLKNA